MQNVFAEELLWARQCSRPCTHRQEQNKDPGPVEFTGILAPFLIQIHNPWLRFIRWAQVHVPGTVFSFQRNNFSSYQSRYSRTQKVSPLDCPNSWLFYKECSFCNLYPLKRNAKFEQLSIFSQLKRSEANLPSALKWKVYFSYPPLTASTRHFLLTRSANEMGETWNREIIGFPRCVYTCMLMKHQIKKRSNFPFST